MSLLAELTSGFHRHGVSVEEILVPSPDEPTVGGGVKVWKGF